MDDTDEEKLLERLQNDTDEAVVEFVVKYYDDLALYAYTQLADTNNAYEAVKELVLRLEEEKFEKVSLPFHPHLYGRLKTICLQFLEGDKAGR